MIYIYNIGIIGLLYASKFDAVQVQKSEKGPSMPSSGPRMDIVKGVSIALGLQ